MSINVTCLAGILFLQSVSKIHLFNSTKRHMQIISRMILNSEEHEGHHIRKVDQRKRSKPNET